MHISRVQVEEGFLNGLDLELPSGLIAIIGERGTGKTSLIELIRFALGAKNYTKETGEESYSHAQSVLQGGEVVITLGDFPEAIQAVRSANEKSVRSSTRFVPPIIFSQKEVETVGVTESGRLALIDAFIRDRNELRAKEAEIANSILSIHVELERLTSEIERNLPATDEYSGLVERLSVLEAQAKDVQAVSSTAATKQSKIADFDAQLSRLSIASSTLDRFQIAARSLADSLISRVEASWDFAPQEPAAADALGDLRQEFDEAAYSVRAAAEKFDTLAAAAAQRREVISEEVIGIETEARSLRAEVEKLVEGAGSLAKQMTNVRGRLSQVEQLQTVLADRKKRLDALRSRRDGLLEDLEEVRGARFDLRAAVADMLNTKLGPRIDVKVEKYGMFADYTRAITEALRGSGLKYNDLAARLSEAMSPRELVECVEVGDFKRLANVAGIPVERAARVIGALRDSGLGEIATSSLDDNIRLRLLDGVEYKDIADLSAGQRCTVVLPIILQHDERILIIDQPEDHIDNAFIAETVIKALRSRSRFSQIIVSTHNANIPVLGNAARVVQLTSDGRNGSVVINDSLDSPAAVNAITTLMEGGMEAFEIRARFYKENASHVAG